MADSTSGFALAAILGGIVLLYSGLRGVSVLKSIQAVIQGKSPATVTQTQPITAATGVLVSSVTPPAGSVGSTVTTAGLAGYEGHCYDYGGAPGTDGRGCWDCSSFANWVFGHDQGRAIPTFAAGSYTGAVHGPPTGLWLVWTGATTVTAAQAQPGDVVVWLTHMGIYLGGGQMISALNPSLGTKITTVAEGSPTGEGPGTYRRLK